MIGDPGERRSSGIASELAVAVGFLTVVPVPERFWSGKVSFGRSFSWFPLVGLLVGGLLSGVALALLTVLPVQVVAALLVALWVSLTGGLHLDGLMDSCDGLFCAKPPGERLEVMRDSRVGAFGVLGAVCVLLVKFAALSVLLAVEGGVSFVFALIAAPVLGRWAMTFAVVAFPYYRHGETLGESFTREAGVPQLALASGLTGAVIIGLGTYADGLSVVVAVLVSLIAVCCLAWFAVAKLGGLTGDVYGMICEVVEVAALVAFTAFVGAGGA
ncbi:MAG: adenosylcobinamide-GDP ribazoletransferase [Rubrobacter sp.]